jgi:hypothetical protein
MSVWGALATQPMYKNVRTPRMQAREIFFVASSARGSVCKRNLVGAFARDDSLPQHLAAASLGRRCGREQIYGGG